MRTLLIEILEISANQRRAQNQGKYGQNFVTYNHVVWGYDL